jgi:hypothetical protein
VRDDEPFGGTCPVHWLVEDIGTFLAGEKASADEVGRAGRHALGLDGSRRSRRRVLRFGLLCGWEATT